MLYRFEYVGMCNRWDMRLISWLSGLSIPARLGLVASIAWLILIVVTAFRLMDVQYGQYEAGASFGKILIFGVLPVVLGWGARWLKMP